MLIQWYPGHMTKARRELDAVMPSQDVIIEVIDARLPSASSNPVLTELRGDTPCVKVLSKSDLADPQITERWLRHLESRPAPATGRRRGGEVLAVAISTERAAEARTRLADLCRRLCPRPSTPGKPVRAMIVGVPNVGKSTLINTLMNRKVAVASDKPAVTRVQQHWVLQNGIVILDSPGLMSPKLDDEAGSLRLALAGSIPDSAIDYMMVATFAAAFFLEHHGDALRARFKLAELPSGPDALIAEIGRRRGCLKIGGVIDLQKAAEALVHAFRSGGLGRISLEAPPDSLAP